MRHLLVQLDETLATHSRLALVGLMLCRTKLKQKLNRLPLPDRAAPHISNGGVAVEPFRQDPFFGQSLMLRAVPFSPTLRQRLDMGGKTGWAKLIMDESVNLLGALQAEATPCLCDLVPLDIDVTPFDNSGTKADICFAVWGMN